MSCDTPGAPPDKAGTQSAVPRSWLNRTVLAIGLGSLFSDTSHEMATAVLPMFLASLTGPAVPAALGLIEGSADLLSSVAKLWAGAIGDRVRQRRLWCSAGYLVTTLSKVSFALATAWWHVLIGRALAWFGRGFRSPLRDALLADDTRQEDYGKAFGLERAGDSLGAVLGPAVALLLVACAVHLRWIFVVTLIPGVLAASLIAFGVRERDHKAPREAAGLLHRARTLPGSLRRYLVAVGIFGIGDFSNTLLILWAAGAGPADGTATRLVTPVALYIGYNAVSALFAYVFGALSDRIGRRTVLGLGYACGTAAAVSIATGGHGLPLMALVFGLSGLCMGAQESVEKATAADFLAEDQRALGFGALAVVNGLGDFVASIAVGGLWAALGVTVAFGFSAALCGAGALALVVLLPHQRAAGGSP
jgi:MFS family permease